MNTLKLEALLAILIFSFIPVSIKLINANPFTIGLVRLGITSLILGIWWRDKINWHFFREKQGFRLILLGILFWAHWVSYFYSIKIGGTSACAIGMSSYGIQMLVMGSVLLNYKLKLKNYLSILMVVIGAYLLIWKVGFNNNFGIGLLLSFFSAGCYAFLPILHQRSNHLYGHETRVFYQFSISLIGFIFFVPKTKWDLTLFDWGGLLYLAIPGTLIAHTLWTKVTAQLPTNLTGIIYYIITPTSLFWARWILNENLNSWQLMGATMIISAAIYNFWSNHD